MWNRLKRDKRTMLLALALVGLAVIVLMITGVFLLIQGFHKIASADLLGIAVPDNPGLQISHEVVPEGLGGKNYSSIYAETSGEQYSMCIDAIGSEFSCENLVWGYARRYSTYALENGTTEGALNIYAFEYASEGDAKHACSYFTIDIGSDKRTVKGVTFLARDYDRHHSYTLPAGRFIILIEGSGEAAVNEAMTEIIAAHSK